MVPSHNNLVQVLDAGTNAGDGYLVMQWVDGVSVAVVVGVMQMHGRCVPVRTSAFIVIQVLRALAYLHRLDSRGRAHGSVRASHVMLGSSGEVKLAPPGDDTAASPADDIREVGILLHCLLTGELTRTPTSEHVLDIPAPLEVLRQHLLAEDPTDRPTAAEALQALETWSGARDETRSITELVYHFTGLDHPRTMPNPPPAQPSPRWPKALFAAVAVAIVATLLLLSCVG